MLHFKQTIRHKSIISIGAVSLMTLASPGIAAPLSDGFYDVGNLGPGNTQANALSADGSVMVGGSAVGSGFDNHAFRWVDGTMSDLGALGGLSSFAFAVSPDGSVVVGQADLSSGSAHAFRWEGGTMIDLGTLGGNFSFADQISADGSVVAGRSRVDPNTSEQHAFRWTGGTMTDLGTLAGGNFSSPNALSADGSVVVGQADLFSGFAHAFRWENGTMTDLGTFGGVNSFATAVSADGSVVAGQANLLGGKFHAFRWENGTKADLGVLSGMNTSIAQHISADGAVVAGASTDNSKDVAAVAFRWAQNTGMQSVSDWVTSGGGTVPVGFSLTHVLGVNADGTVIAGGGRFNGFGVGWLAKASGGFISDTADFNRSIIATGGSAAQGGGLAPSNLALFGSHHRTLLDSGLAMGPNGTCVWSTADAARNNTTDANTELAEIGLCRDFAGARVGAGIGTTYSRQGWQLGGNAQYHGRYVLAEIDKAFATANGGSLQASLLGYYGFSTSQLNRAYANGAAIDVSSGTPDVRTTSIRARLDWKDAATLGGFKISPYAAFTWSQSRVDGYTETGGGFPVTYNAAQTNTNDLRIGSAFARKLSLQADFRLGLEYVHQFQNNTAGINGQIIGLSTFNLPGQTIKQDWARITVDIDYQLKSNAVLTAGFNAATTGNEPTVGVTIGLRASF